MSSWSLICFTLLTQGAVGLVFAGTLGRWLEGTGQVDMALPTTVLALGLTALGLVAALTHLAAPRRAPHALRNPATSWLSREVLLVPIFALALTFSMLAQRLGNSTVLVILEITTLCLGGVALAAMTGVYRLKTVPAWNTSATTLEFVGSALLLGGALSTVWASFGTANSWGPAFAVAVTGMCLGVLLKFAAIHPGMAAERLAHDRVWYSLPAMVLSAAQSRMLRSVLNSVGAALILMGAAKGSRLELVAGLITLFAAEVAGRLRFYRLYGRIGLCTQAFGTLASWLVDVVNLLQKMIPNGVWLHDAQDGNGDAHLKSGLVGPSESIPIIDGKPGLSTWQNIFFCEFDGPRSERRIVVTVLGNDIR